jgi:hypothetical protein
VGEKEETEYVALRVISRIVNEAFLALSEGVATAQDIDEAMKLGANYPKGALEWAEEIGASSILQTPDSFREAQDEAYLATPSLRERAAGGSVLEALKTAQVGSGTFWSLSWPRATSLPSSLRVMITCQSCWLRPCMTGSATTSTRPSFIGRKKSVLLLTPTANCPLSSTAAEAPTLAALSTAVA